MTDSPFDSTGLVPLPHWDDREQLNIAVVGAGSIVTSAHLPAYVKCGYRVVGILDKDSERAKQVADQFAIPKVYPDLHELLSDPSVGVVDIATPPAAQEQIAQQVARAGKHLLCQKPLAIHAADAKALAELADEQGVTLGVNVNMRWSPAIRALKQLIDKKRLGQFTSVSIQVNFWDSWDTWGWLKDVDELMIRYDAIHLIDAVRYLFGEAESMYATATRLPGHTVAGETDVLLVMRYADGFTIYIHDSANNWAEDTRAEFRIEGTAGMAKGLLGVWYDYPVGRADRIEFCDRSSPGEWFTHEPPGRWVPDAWAWAMAEVFDAVRENRPPVNNGQDHVRTLEWVEAAYRSIQTRQVISL